MKKTDEIIDVWASNLEEELLKISKLIEKYRFVGMDTEFAGFIVKSPNGASEDFYYRAEQQNVNLLKLIQIGITLGDDQGELPSPERTWQFNFKFDIDSDLQSPESISLLRKSGIDFNRFLRDGIDVYDFAPMFFASGLVMNDRINWVTFQCGYDLAYLMKLVTATPMPKSSIEYNQALKIYFPNFYDLRVIMKHVQDSVGSLQEVSEELGVKRYGPTHQAGSDSYVTLRGYYAAMKKYFDGAFVNEKFRNKSTQ